MSTREGIVIEGTGGVWVVRSHGGEQVSAALAGRLKQEVREFVKLAPGDHVIMEPDERAENWRITEIAPRRSVLARREPGGRRGERVLAANVDQACVVFSVANPEPHPRMIDRFLVVCEANELEAHVIFNKIDLVHDKQQLAKLVSPYVNAGYPVHCTSVKQDIGLDELRGLLKGKVTAVTGPSGVGKSSLLNTLHPGIALRTAEISMSVNKGRHTTVGSKLIPLPGDEDGYLVDTPGLREIGMWGLPSESLDQCFPEFRSYLGDCKFQDCDHEVEPACVVRGAVDEGRIDRGRYDSYIKLLGELRGSERQR